MALSADVDGLELGGRQRGHACPLGAKTIAPLLLCICSRVYDLMCIICCWSLAWLRKVSGAVSVDTAGSLGNVLADTFMVAGSSIMPWRNILAVTGLVRTFLVPLHQCRSEDTDGSSKQQENAHREKAANLLLSRKCEKLRTESFPFKNDSS